MLKSLFSTLTLLLLPFMGLSASAPELPVQAVVFDFGGVIATVDRQAVAEFIQESFGLSKEELRTVLSQWRLVLETDQSDLPFWHNLADEKGVQITEEWIADWAEVTSFHRMPGMFKLVCALKDAGYQVGMLSNVKGYHAAIVREQGYYELFHPCLLSHEIGVEKPDSEAYRILLGTLGLNPEEVVFVDDQQQNVDAANALGIHGVLFRSASDLKMALRDLQLDF